MTLVVKLGSSVVAADDGSLRADVLDSVCAQVGALRQGGERVVLVTSGAIARGMRLLDLDQRPRAMDELQACSAVGQGDLFQAYRERLEAGGTKAAQVLLTLSDVSERSHYLNARQALERLLAWGLVPVINENDTTSTDEITFGDNDFLAALVAALLNARLLVLLTNTDGVFTADPRTDPGAALVGRIDDASSLAEIRIGESSTLGRGGMQSKIASARIASESGVPVVICNGTRAGELAAAASGEEIGTRFTARVEGRLSPYKLWLKYAKRPAGSVVVDAGAAVRLRESGSSLLAVGVTGADGSFQPGDAVWVVERGIERPLGKGISEYSSDDVARTAGHRSAYVREHFPDAPEEVIHRDRFVLL
ncbi:MAG TPA: glutamate 5-kinase [Solirubrobacterales bacterium]|nr:glutamate 5-kinase [Solirubrobacterales bacterium]